MFRICFFEWRLICFGFCNKVFLAHWVCKSFKMMYEYFIYIYVSVMYVYVLE